MTAAEGLYSTLVTNCIFNVFLFYTAIALNIITIQALRKTSSLPRTLKTLLLSLAASDLAVGLLAHPIFVAHLIIQIQQNPSDNAYGTVFTIFSAFQKSILACASFFNVVAITVDRFLAIHLHLRYQELVTHKRVVAVVISTWVISAFLSLLVHAARLDWIPEKVSGILFAAIDAVCFITTGFLHYKIYASVRHHTDQIQALQAQEEAQNREMKNAVRLRKTALATFYIYFLFLACYVPIFCVNLAELFCDETALIQYLRYYVWTIMLFNSSLNPLIYSWKMRHIRHAVINILRNVLPCRH
ncbi:adenosine receptor A2a-like [Porites lutea]|uniref:adenosine receptor A2a-like n=1 Tax=Porites lutea TaxID=51062 RepID=UPI003CC54591